MSKGHAPRQGRDDKAFAAGYDGIDWGRAKIVGPVIASDGGNYSATQNDDGSITVTPDAPPPTGEPVSYKFDDAPEGQQRTGWPSGTPDEVQGDCSVVAVMRSAEELADELCGIPKTCQHCKHWVKTSQARPEQCVLDDVRDMVVGDDWQRIEPPADFGCSLWEAKE